MPQPWRCLWSSTQWPVCPCLGALNSSTGEVLAQGKDYFRISLQGWNSPNYSGSRLLRDAYVRETFSHLWWDSHLKYLTFLWIKNSETPAERRVTTGGVAPVLGEAALTAMAAPSCPSHPGAGLGGFSGAQLSPGSMKTLKEPGGCLSLGFPAELQSSY